ncbi:MAG: DUF4838 domain-containing protein [Verrucomicrobiae bacterium]|nr:DUF4838 domain-containing protein [Verrucomicrobiae bacterium]
MKTLPLLGSLLIGLTPWVAPAAITLASGGEAKVIIVQQPGASAPERHAARELQDALQRITGATFTLVEASNSAPANALLIGPGPLARMYFPEVPLESFGAEEIIIKTKGNRLLLAGGRPRGTLYAVSQFLQQHCGVRWWTPWAADYPPQKELKIGSLHYRYTPVFESRDPYWYVAFNKEWAVRNFSNSQSAGIPEEMGGCIRYKGFVHTFYPLIPPEKYFAQHPEWFSMIKGQRTNVHGQLCLTNPRLREEVVVRVRQWLKESPQARIVSISQNDWYGYCECPECKASDDAEGSHAGTLVAFINDIAEKLEPEFPHVAFDTLAYQYTRKPPRTLKPRPNVIIRLCSIECNFREPLDHPSNASFAADIQGWAQICKRLYIWDYTTDFAHYVQPHPNWFVLGPNVRFFARHNVKGLFEQGAYQSHGSEMAELRAWLLAQLLWNPFQDDRALLREFLRGYYGDAAIPIEMYLNLMHQASEGYKLTCFSRTDTPFHHFKYLSQAQKLWDEALVRVRGNPELERRVEVGRLPLGYVWLSRWEKLRQECREMGAEWPLPASRKAYAEQWVEKTKGDPAAPWTQVRLLNESGLTPQKFLERFAQDPAL